MRTVRMPRTVSVTSLERALDEVERMEQVVVEEYAQVRELKKYIKEELRKAQRGKQ